MDRTLCFYNHLSICKTGTFLAVADHISVHLSRHFEKAIPIPIILIQSRVLANINSSCQLVCNFDLYFLGFEFFLMLIFLEIEKFQFNF